MGWISDACSAVGSFVSGACSVIRSAISSVGNAIGNAATSIVKTLETVIDKVIDVVKVVAIKLGIIEEKDDIEELGARACESDLKPEDFDSTVEYIEHLKTNVELDKEKMQNRTETDKLAHKGIGIAIMKNGIKEKMGLDLTDGFLYTVGKNDLSFEETYCLMESFKNAGMTSTAKFDNYMKNDLSLDERIKMGDIIIDGFVNGNKGSTREGMEDKLVEIELKHDR